MNLKSYLKYYISSLFLSFSILFVILLCSVISNPEITAPHQEEISKNIYLPQKEDGFNLFLTFSEGNVENPFGFFLINFNPVTGQIATAILPKDFELLNSSISECFKNNGAKKTVSDLKNQLNIPIEKYICLHRETFEYIMSFSDNIEINLPKEIIISDKFSIPSGKTVLNGSLAFELMKNLSKNSTDLSVSCEITSEFINKIIPLFGKSTGERIFTHTVNNCLTNISYIDYDNFLKPCKFLSELKENPAFSIVILDNKDQNIENLFNF